MTKVTKYLFHTVVLVSENERVLVLKNGRFASILRPGRHAINHWRQDETVPSAELLALIDARWPLEPAQRNYHGEVANRYVFKDGGGEIGFISSVTEPFCGECTRARLSFRM